MCYNDSTYTEIIDGLKPMENEKIEGSSLLWRSDCLHSKELLEATAREISQVDSRESVQIF